MFLVLNDDRYGAIKWLQETLFEGRWGETDLANPDFPALARAFGARGERVDGVDSLSAAIKTALAAEGPTVLELPNDDRPALGALKQLRREASVRNLDADSALAPSVEFSQEEGDGRRADEA